MPETETKPKPKPSEPEPETPDEMPAVEETPEEPVKPEAAAPGQVPEQDDPARRQIARMRNRITRQTAELKKYREEQRIRDAAPPQPPQLDPMTRFMLMTGGRRKQRKEQNAS